MSGDDLADLQYAKTLLEHPSLAAKITGAIGAPIERGLALLPRSASDIISAATNRALFTALDFAVFTMDDRKKDSTNWIHKTLVGVTGAAGGAFGLPALAVELPVSTTIILRSVADIARSEGDQIRSLDAKLACLEVFAFGGPSKSDDATDAGYFAVRAALSKALSDAAEYIAKHGIVKNTAPPLMRFVTQVAARFGIPVTEKAIAQSLPLVGAAGGALINTMFIDHFQSISRGHFIVRRLERTYAPDIVKDEYLKLPSK